jgi:hypothetical protein
MSSDYSTSCPKCYGAGKTEAGPCMDCAGTGLPPDPPTPNAQRIESLGGRYFAIGLSSGVEIHAHASRVEIKDGSAVLLDPQDRVLMAFGVGGWTYVYAASMIDGIPIAAEHWPGVLAEGFRR